MSWKLIVRNNLMSAGLGLVVPNKLDACLRQLIKINVSEPSSGIDLTEIVRSSLVARRNRRNVGDSTASGSNITSPARENNRRPRGNSVSLLRSRVNPRTVVRNHNCFKHTRAE